MTRLTDPRVWLPVISMSFLVAMVPSIFVRGTESRFTHLRALATSNTSNFLILSSIDLPTKKYCISAPTLTPGTNLVLASCIQSNNTSNNEIRFNSSSSLALRKGIWWNFNAEEGWIVSRDDSSLCFARNKTKLVLSACDSNEQSFQWTTGWDNTIVLLRNKPKVITVPSTIVAEGINLEVLDKSVHASLSQSWFIDHEYNYVSENNSTSNDSNSSLTITSQRPTVKKTSIPTTRRSVKPSLKPSSKPSRKPSSKPTKKPSIIPSRRPTLKPSQKIMSKKPSVPPTKQPTLEPTPTPPFGAYFIRSSKPSYFYKGSTFNFNFGHNNPWCNQYGYNGRSLVVLHSSNYANNAFIASAEFYLCRNWEQSYFSSSYFDMSSYSFCNDNKWHLTLISCTWYSCPSNFASATILSQSKAFKTHGNPYCSFVDPTIGAPRYWIGTADSISHGSNIIFDYGQNDPSCSNGYGLVALQSLKDNRTIVASTTVSKCSSSSSRFMLSLCDDFWRVSFIDCVGDNCPTTLGPATVLAQGAPFKTIGNPYCSYLDPNIGTPLHWIGTTDSVYNLTSNRAVSSFGIYYGHDDPACYQGGQTGNWLVVMHSPNYSNTSFAKSLAISKCSSLSRSWEVIDVCDDDQWRVSLIDCVGNECPTSFTTATILAQSKTFKTYGHPYCSYLNPNIGSSYHWIGTSGSVYGWSCQDRQFYLGVDFGHNDPACYQGSPNGHWLVVIHSPNHSNVSFVKGRPISKCSSFSGPWEPWEWWEIDICDDDQWRLSVIDCVEYDCPTSLESATILATSKVFKTYGHPTCSNLEPSCHQYSFCSSDYRYGLYHPTPQDGAVVKNIAFSSHFDKQNFRAFGEITPFQVHLHDKFKADVWSWIGNIRYGDFISYQNNVVNFDDSYPLRRWSNVPVSATWDEYEYGANNGKDNVCRRRNQNNYAFFYGLAESDPRHPSQYSPQLGVYSSHMFAKPLGGNGIHLIQLDTRTHRSPTRVSGVLPCEYENSTMLGSEQWEWLENELGRKSELKIIGSSIPILPPTYRGRSLTDYCSYDGPGGSFDRAGSAINEFSTNSVGPSYSIWGDIPQERTKLLQLCQKSINDGHTKKIVFISGNKYNSEIMAKAIPQNDVYGAEQLLYEVTTSFSLERKWSANTRNSNSLVYAEGQHGEVCSRSDVCVSQSSYGSTNFDFNYGGVKVDWEDRMVILALFTPNLKDDVTAKYSFSL